MKVEILKMFFAISFTCAIEALYLAKIRKQGIVVVGVGVY